MSTYNDVLPKVASHVNALFSEYLNPKSLYHNINHTLDVVKNAEEISREMKLKVDEIEIIMIAAWFHDTGYLQSPTDHEERSAEIATKFLRTERYPEEKIEKIIGCIRATKVPQKPKNIFEQITCDADLLHLGMQDGIDKGEILRMELENTSGESISEEEWIKHSINFFTQHHFHTPYAVKKYTDRHTQNLLKLEKRLKELEKNG